MLRIRTTSRHRASLVVLWYNIGYSSSNAKVAGPIPPEWFACGLCHRTRERTEYSVLNTHRCNSKKTSCTRDNREKIIEALFTLWWYQTFFNTIITLPQRLFVHAMNLILGYIIFIHDKLVLVPKSYCPSCALHNFKIEIA